MTELEDQLRDALRRKTPPPGFTDRVVSRVEADRPTRTLATGRSAFMRWAAAAALVAALGGTIEYRKIREERERARGEAAKEQVMQALRIAGSKLQVVQARIKEIGS